MPKISDQPPNCFSQLYVFINWNRINQLFTNFACINCLIIKFLELHKNKKFLTQFFNIFNFDTDELAKLKSLKFLKKNWMVIEIWKIHSFIFYQFKFCMKISVYISSLIFANFFLSKRIFLRILFFDIDFSEGL